MRKFIDGAVMAFLFAAMFVVVIGGMMAFGFMLIAPFLAG